MCYLTWPLWGLSEIVHVSCSAHCLAHPTGLGKWSLLMRVKIVSLSLRDCIRERQRWELWAWWASCTSPLCTLGWCGHREEERCLRSVRSTGLTCLSLNVYLHLLSSPSAHLYVYVSENAQLGGRVTLQPEAQSHTEKGLFSLRTRGIATEVGRMRIGNTYLFLWFGVF